LQLSRFPAFVWSRAAVSFPYDNIDMVMSFSGRICSCHDSSAGWKLDYEFTRTGIAPLVCGTHPVAAYVVYPGAIVTAGLPSCSDQRRVVAGYMVEHSSDQYLCPGCADVSPVESRGVVTVRFAVAWNRRADDGSDIDDDIHEKPYGRIIVIFTTAVLFAS